MLDFERNCFKYALLYLDGIKEPICAQCTHELDISLPHYWVTMFDESQFTNELHHFMTENPYLEPEKNKKG